MTEKLFEEFPPVSTQEWEALIEKDLKGADYQKKLVWKPLEGFTVQPYYREEDITELPHLQVDPGRFPFVRGNKENNDWIIHQTFMAKGRLIEANAEAVDALSKGVGGVGFVVDPDYAYTVADMAVLFKDIDLSVIPVAFDYIDTASPVIIKNFLEYSKGLPNVNPDNLRVRFGVDPLHHLLENTFNLEVESARFLTCVKLAQDYPRAWVASLSGYLFSNMGASVLQELAYVLAIASEYMQYLSTHDVPVSIASKSLYFQMGISSNYFMEVAKFRVLRHYWALLLEGRGEKKLANLKAKVHAVTSAWNQTVYDRYVNLLRGTTEAMSAAIAGVDSMEVLPFDYATGAGNDFSRRLARNTQIILKEESHFNKVTDPAGGSYYVETLTTSLSVALWRLYNNILYSGGFFTNYTTGKIPKDIEETVAKRRQLLETRRETLLGVNQYPNFTETALDSLTLEQLKDSERGAAPFEYMRLKTERSGKNPKAFMLTFGNLAMCRARAQFSSNFFAVAGIKVIDNNRFATIEEGVKAALESKAQLIIACSSDDEYAQAVPQIASLVAGKAIVVVAGEPACKEDLEKQGINHFISVRNNLLQTLKQYQAELGI